MKAHQEKVLKRETAQTESNRMNPELGSLLLACSFGTFHDAELPVRIQPSRAPATPCACSLSHTELCLPCYVLILACLCPVLHMVSQWVFQNRKSLRSQCFPTPWKKFSLHPVAHVTCSAQPRLSHKSHSPGLHLVAGLGWFRPHLFVHICASHSGGIVKSLLCLWESLLWSLCSMVAVLAYCDFFGGEKS